MSTIDRYVATNRRYAEALPDEKRPLAQPSGHIAVVTCMDARIDPAAALGIDLGEAHVIRNAGGILTEDVLRSLSLSQSLLGTREIMLIHHTGCGLNGTEADLGKAIEQKTGSFPQFSLGAFECVEAAVRSAMDELRECPFLVHTDAIRGFVYDVETGLLGEAEASGRPQ